MNRILPTIIALCLAFAIVAGAAYAVSPLRPYVEKVSAWEDGSGSIRLNTNTGRAICVVPNISEEGSRFALKCYRR